MWIFWNLKAHTQRHISNKTIPLILLKQDINWGQVIQTHEPVGAILIQTKEINTHRMSYKQVHPHTLTRCLYSVFTADVKMEQVKEHSVYLDNLNCWERNILNSDFTNDFSILRELLVLIQLQEKNTEIWITPISFKYNIGQSNIITRILILMQSTDRLVCGANTHTVLCTTFCIGHLLCLQYSEDTTL